MVHSPLLANDGSSRLGAVHGGVLGAVHGEWDGSRCKKLKGRERLTYLGLKKKKMEEGSSAGVLRPMQATTLPSKDPLRV